jgi:hypothetical protein
MCDFKTHLQSTQKSNCIPTFFYISPGMTTTIEQYSLCNVRKCELHRNMAVQFDQLLTASGQDEKCQFFSSTSLHNQDWSNIRQHAKYTNMTIPSRIRRQAHPNHHAAGQGCSIWQISAITKSKHSTVEAVLHQWKLHQSIKDLPKAVRPSKLSDCDRRVSKLTNCRSWTGQRTPRTWISLSRGLTLAVNVGPS